MDDKLYQKKFEEMRQRHELDKQVLLAQFQQHANSLQHHHQLQLQKHFEVVLLQQKQQLDALNQSQELASVKFKEKEKESAVASNAVKKHLQNFVIGRQKDKLEGSSNHNLNASGSYGWHHPLIDDVDHRMNLSGRFPPYSKCDFPLRKTASEPNLKVRSRLKQKLSNEQRSSPLFPRQDTKDVKINLANRIKKKITAENAIKNKSMSNMSNTNSMSSSLASRSNLSPSSSNQSEADFYGNAKKTNHPSLYDLYSSPSLPNLNIGMGKRPVEQSMLMSSKDELNRLVSRTASLPGPLLKLPHKQNFPLSLPVERNDAALRNFELEKAALLAVKALPDYDKDSGSLPSSHGPIRPSPLTRTHRSLIRTQSAPSNVTSQLQQHILQKNKSLKQYNGQKLMKQGSVLKRDPQTGLHVYYEQEVDKKLHSRFQESLGYLSTTDRENIEKYEERQPIIESSPMAVDQSQAEEIRAASADNYKHHSNSYHRANLNPPSASNFSKPLHPPLQRTQSSPAASLIKKGPSLKRYRYTTGIAYSPMMLKHGCSCGDDHTEHPGRVKVVWERLISRRLVSDNERLGCPCELIECRKARTDELELVHTTQHIMKYGTTSLARKELDLTSKLIVLPCGGVGVDNGIDADTVWNEQFTVNAARMAVGCVLDLAQLVAEKKLKNGFALVRPPGHHAQKDLAMAFCYFNSVAVAARKLQASGCAKKILILDWDIHHCNGTQNIFYEDPSVLVISLHRYDQAQFFPGTGAINEIGSRQGVGFNINIAFSSKQHDPTMGDAEYLAAFRSIILPVVRQFSPDIILISSGFSAASGHSSVLGGYTVSPECFAYLTQLMMEFGGGKVVMALEGGFELEALCNCTEACVRTLLEDTNGVKLSEEAINSRPNNNAVNTIREVASVLNKFWKDLLPESASRSHADCLNLSRENETCKALASLSVNNKSLYRDRCMDEDDISDPRPHSYSDSSGSGGSSPLDVVNTSNPSSPINRVRFEKLIKSELPT